jgi:hypothetical protein
MKSAIEYSAVLRQTLTTQGKTGETGLAKLEALLKTVVNRDHTNVVIKAKKALEALSRETKTQ